MKTWEDSSVAAADRAKALVGAVVGRKDLKRLGKWLEDSGDVALREAILAFARKRGVDLPDEAVEWPGKRLLRRSQAREAESQVRTNPIARDEAFECMHCGMAVPAHGRTARDHCPRCLRSRHVDVVPGDRAADCGGRLDPVGVTLATRRIMIRYVCTRCGGERFNRALTDGDPPDDWEALVRLSSGVLS